MAQTEGTSLPVLEKLEQTGPNVAFAYGVMRGAGDGGEARERILAWRRARPGTALIVGTSNAARLQAIVECFS